MEEEKKLSPEALEDKPYNEDRSDDPHSPRRFFYVPIFFIVYPLTLFIGSAFAFFKQGSIVAAAITEEGTYLAGDAISGFSSLLSAPIATKILYFIGLVFAILIGVYGIVSSFVPKLREVKTMGLTLAIGSLLSAGLNTASFILYLFHVHSLTVAKIAAEGKETTVYFPSAFASVSFWVCFLIPIAFLVWWMLVYFRQNRLFEAAKTAKAQDGEQGNA